MDAAYSDDAERFRSTVQAFLAEQLPPDWRGVGALTEPDARAFAARWRDTLFDHGFLAPSWPREYGGPGLTPVEQVVLAEEFARAGVPSGVDNDIFSIVMIGNTLLHWGSEEQKQYYLPRILSGEHRWCQGYSEPDAGSDLASLRTRAVRDGDEWVIDGQKTWTSAGHLANWIFVLARTDPSAQKHRGISLLLVPMDQPGVEVRPIRNIAGDSDFNEVFFTGARCPADNVLGPVDGGWSVAMSLLGFERGDSAATLPIMFRAEFDRLVQLARETGADGDAVVRDRIADAYVRVEVMRFLGLRALSGFLRGDPPGADAAISKLYWSEYHQGLTELALDVLDVEALVVSGRPPTTVSLFQTDDPGAPNDSASWIGSAMISRSGTIYAGTSEIQRNIIGERLLGLPR